jgi:hypothetical protein
MLQTNLSSRPFYNVRAVRVGLALAAVLVTALTIVSIGRAITLSAAEAQLSAEANQYIADAGRIRADASRLLAKVDQKQLAQLTSAAGEVNAVIEQRAFSWITLLSEIEAALPGDVRVTRVEPRIERDAGIIVSIAAEAEQVEDSSAFMEALERGGRFHDVLPKAEAFNDGVIDVLIEGRYTAARGGIEAGAAAGVQEGARREP